MRTKVEQTKRANKSRGGFQANPQKRGGSRIMRTRSATTTILETNNFPRNQEITIPRFTETPELTGTPNLPPRMEIHRDTPTFHSGEFCYFDIETGPLEKERILEIMPEIKPAANLKDPLKISVDIEEKKQAFFEKAALSSTTGEVLAIGLLGIGNPDPDDFEKGTTLFSDELGGEKKLLERFWEVWREGKRMVGFNCHAFDIPFLIQRSWSHSLKVPVELMGKWMPERLVDLLVLWRVGNREQKISLSQLGKFFGVGEKTGNGAEFARLYREERFRAKEYLLNDILLTKLCALKMGIGR